MDAGRAQHPDGDRPRRIRAVAATWCVSAGVILAAAALICRVLRVVSAQQAMALGLPGALLIVGGLIAAAIPDAATGRSLGFQAGFRVGWLLTRLRSFFRPRRDGR
jgi:hypothetical protein